MPQTYSDIRNLLTPLLFVAILLYFPGYVILQKWIPKYMDSLAFLGIMLPIVVYTSLVAILTNNYLQIYRKENVMMIINALSVVISLILFAIAVYIFNSITLLLILVVIAAMLRAILSEIAVMKIINMNFCKKFITEAFITIGFVVSASCLPLIYGAISYSMVLSAYLFFNRKSIIVLKKYVHL